MKLVEKFIYEIDEARNDFYNNDGDLDNFSDFSDIDFRSFYSYMSRDYDFENDLNELTEITDKYIYLKYIINDVLNELHKCEYALSTQMLYLKEKRYIEYPKNYTKKEIYFKKKYYQDCIKELNEFLEYFNKELNEIIIFNSEHNNFYNFENENQIKIPDFNKDKPEIKQKIIKKLQFTATYESIERLFQLLIKSGFLNPANSNNLGAILKDTIQKFNEDKGTYEDFNKNSFIVKNSTIRKSKQINDINKELIDNKSDDIIKFRDLLKYLNNIIPKDL